MSAHSRYFSPSSMARRIGCTASAAMEDGREDTPSEFALWGTAAHAICELCAGGKTTTEPRGLLHQIVEGVKVTEEMVAACDAALAHMREFTGCGPVETEKRVSLEHAGHPEMFGTADVVRDEPFSELFIFDYKFGAGVAVAVENNPALMSYALMAAGPLLHTYEWIHLGISQPRTSDRLQRWSIRPGTLAAWRDDVLLPAIEAIKTGKTSFGASADNCRFCKAVHDCPAYAKEALAVAQADFAGVVQEPTLTPELVQQIYPQLPLLADFIKRVEAMAMEMAGQGKLAGFKLVAGRGSRAWIDEAAVQELLQSMGADPFEHKLLSPAKAEKLGKEFKKAIAPYVGNLAGKPTIAPENDRRRAISTAQEDFQQLETEP